MLERGKKSSKSSNTTLIKENQIDNPGRLESKSSTSRPNSKASRPNPRPTVALGKRFIDALPTVAARVIHWDAGVTGFGLDQYPSGVLTFIVDYRNVDGRKRRVKLGRFGAITVEQARSQARGILGRVAHGEDPAETIGDRRTAPTVGDLLDDYIEKHVEVVNGRRMQDDAKRIVDRFLRPALGALKVASVTRQDVLKLRRTMQDTPRQANLTLAVLSKAFSLAEEWGLRREATNPCRRVPRFEEVERERFLTDVEMGRLGLAMVEAETEGLPWRVREGANAKHRAKGENARSVVNPAALAVVRLLLFTGARASEILELRWADVDMERGELALPSRKRGLKRPHPVSTFALDVLAAQTRQDGSPWVFPAPLDASRSLSISVLENAWQALRRRAGLDDVRLHDLRHTGGTFASQTGANAFHVRDFLRHKTLAMTSRYANKAADPIRAMSETIGERVAMGLRGGKPPPS